jgi:4-amino-4-deoxy-L-arabinose transferase-like glycosyltransferase
VTEKRLTRLDFAIATALGVGYFTLLAATSSGIGYVRDEGHYFRAAEVYNRWFEALWDDIAVVRTRDGRTVRGAHIRGDRASGVVVRGTEGRIVVPAAEIADLQILPHPDKRRAFDKGFIDSIWRENSEHPALLKSLFVLSWRLFYEKLAWTNQGDAFRIPAWFFAALLLFLTFLWATELYDRRTGLVAAGALATLPHVFYHAHLACFDVPMTTMWLAVLYAFWKSQRSTYWAVTTATIFAAALATKHNAFFLPFVVLVYWVASRWRELGFPVVDGVRRLQLPPLPLAFFAVLVVTPILYYAHWPYLWNAPVAKLGGYLGYHMQHEHYDVPYLGTILRHPPFPVPFPFVMSLFTVPEMTVLLGGVGFCFVAWRLVPWGRLTAVVRKLVRRPAAEVEPPAGAPLSPFPVRAHRLYETDQVELLLLIACFLPFAIIAHPKTPVFGGTKHWMPAMPFVAIFAAVGLNLALAGFARRFPGLGRRPGALWAALAALALAPSVVASVRVHPFGTSYHNLFAGGLNGAARLGNTWQFWGGAFRNAADWLNQHAERGAGVCHHKTNTKGWVFYQRDGIVRRDLVGLTGLGRECRFEEADYYVYQHQPEYQGDEVQTWQEFGTVFPAHVVALDGMPLVSVYRKAVRLMPEGAAGGDVLYGRAVAGSWSRDGDAIRFSAWRRRGGGRGTCSGVYARGAVVRDGGARAGAGDPDEAFRSLFEMCFGTRLPR